MAAPGLVLVTRPQADADRIIASLAARGIAALAWPLTEIRPTGGPVEVPPGTGALLFTSAHGVAAFAHASPRRDLPALCVGPRTAEAARQAGFTQTESAEGDAAALARLALAHGARRMLHPRGRDAAGDLAGDLARHGVAVDQAILYAAEAVAAIPAPVRAALDAREVALLTAWSPRNAVILAGHIARHPGWPHPGLGAVAISARAAQPLGGLGLGAIRTAQRPDGAAMLAAIEDAIVAAPR